MKDNEDLDRDKEFQYAREQIEKWDGSPDMLMVAAIEALRRNFAVATRKALRGLGIRISRQMISYWKRHDEETFRCAKMRIDLIAHRQ